MRQTIHFSNENLEIESTNPFLDSLHQEDVDVTTQDTSSTPEAAELDVVDDSKEIDTIHSQLVDTNDVVTGLESIALTLTKIRDAKQPIDRLSYNLLNQRYENVTRKFPHVQQGGCFTSLESLNHDNGVISLESVMDKVKSGIKAMIKWVKDLFEKVVDLFRDVMMASTMAQDKSNVIRKDWKDQPWDIQEVSVPSFLTEPDLSPESIGGLISLLKATMTECSDLYNLSVSGFKLNEESLDRLEALYNDGVLMTTLKKFVDKPMLGGFKIEIVDDKPKYVRLDNGDNVIRKFTASEIDPILKANMDLAVEVRQFKRLERHRRELIVVISQDEFVRKLEEEGKDVNTKRAQLKFLRFFLKLSGEFAVFEKFVMSRTIAVLNATNNIIAKTKGSK